jgi:hypothetical protein
VKPNRRADAQQTNYQQGVAMSTKTPTKPAPRQTVHRARIPADALTVLVVQTLALAGIWVCAVVVSFTGLIAAAGWANVAPGQRVFVPLFIDGVLIGGSLAYLVAKERHDRASRTIAAAAMATFATLSVAGNAVHALAAATSGAQRAVGVALAVAAPVAILVTTELLARTVIASPDEHQPTPSRSARRAARTASSQPAPTAATPGQTPQPVAPKPAAVTARTTRNATGTGSADRAALREQAVQMAATGMSHREIAEALGVKAHTTVGRWVAVANADAADGEPVQDGLRVAV